jgi:hypothetical protein
MRLWNWLLDAVRQIREVAKAAAYARQHPTELSKNHDQKN